MGVWAKAILAHLSGSIHTKIIGVHLHVVHTGFQCPGEELKIVHLVTDQNGPTRQFLLQVCDPCIRLNIHGVPAQDVQI